MTNPITHVYVDLDGVLADFWGGVCNLFAKWPDPPTDYDGLASAFGVTEAEMWQRIDRAGSLFWSRLEAYPWNEELLGIAQNVADEGVYVASSPSWHGSSAAGKIEWMTTHFAHPGEPFREFMLGNHKHLLAKPRAVLIDDSPAQIEAWIDAGGVGFLWPQPWNTKGDCDMARKDCLSRLAVHA